MNSLEEKEISLRKIQDCLQIYADMIGPLCPEKIIEYGFVPGLQMDEETQWLKEQQRLLNEDICQLLLTQKLNLSQHYREQIKERNYADFMHSLARVYVAAERKKEEIDETLKDYRMKVDELDFTIENRKARTEKVSARLEESCAFCSFSILTDAKELYLNTINDLLDGWDMHFKEFSFPFGIAEKTRIVTSSKQDRHDVFEEILRPLEEAAENYVKEYLFKFEKKLSSMSDLYLNSLDKELGVLRNRKDEDSVYRNEIIEIFWKEIFNIKDIIIYCIAEPTWDLGLADQIFPANLYIQIWQMRVSQLCAQAKQIIKEKLLNSQNYVLEQIKMRTFEIEKKGRISAEKIRSGFQECLSSIYEERKEWNQKLIMLQQEDERIKNINKTLLNTISDINQLINGRILTDTDVKNMTD